jgi:hypothetical protein
MQRSLLFVHPHQALNAVVSAVTELIQKQSSPLFHQKITFAPGGGELLCPLGSQNSAMAFLS